jgi:CBS domain-containing protein
MRQSLRLGRIGGILTAVHWSAPVGAFLASVVAWHPHDAYPAVDVDGRFAGLLLLARLAAVNGPDRDSTRVADVMIPAGAVATVEPQTPLVEALTATANVHRLAVVLADDRPAGVLTGGDVRRAVLIGQSGGVADRSGSARGEWGPAVRPTQGR